MARHISIVTIHPAFAQAYSSFGVFRSAESQGLIKLDVVNLRDYAIDKNGTIDDSPYGGGDGMVMRPEPLAHAVDSLRQAHPTAKVILTTPVGNIWQQAHACSFAESNEDLIFICGRFGGIDQRFIDLYVDHEFSLGDFVLSGGELPALAIVDSILRFIPGVLGHNDSAQQDSFATGFNGGLEHPLYTRPSTFRQRAVPSVLMNGNHQAIENWRREQSLKLTRSRRPDLSLRDNFEAGT